MKENGQYYDEFRASSDIPEGCPVPKNTYKANYAPNGLNIPEYAEGKYMLDVKSYKGRIVGPSAKIYFEIGRY
jgi:hypothetical protein